MLCADRCQVCKERQRSCCSFLDAKGALRTSCIDVAEISMGQERFWIGVLATKGEREGADVTYRMCRFPEMVGETLMGSSFAQIAPFFLPQGSSFRGLDPVCVVVHSPGSMRVQMGLWCGGSVRKTKVHVFNFKNQRFGDFLVSHQADQDQKKSSGRKRKKEADHLPRRGRKRGGPARPQQSMMN